nr:hypothetical protein [Tanacetum cinerariifolium]
MSTEIELTLEQSQQGASNDVLVSIEGVEELKRNVWIKGENKAALPTLKAETGSLHMLSVFTKMRILLEPIANKLLVEHLSDSYVFTMKMRILLEPTANKLLKDSNYLIHSYRVVCFETFRWQSAPASEY